MAQGLKKFNIATKLATCLMGITVWLPLDPTPSSYLTQSCHYKCESWVGVIGKCDSIRIHTLFLGGVMATLIPYWLEQSPRISNITFFTLIHESMMSERLKWVEECVGLSKCLFSDPGFTTGIPLMLITIFFSDLYNCMDTCPQWKISYDNWGGEARLINSSDLGYFWYTYPSSITCHQFYDYSLVMVDDVSITLTVVWK